MHEPFRPPNYLIPQTTSILCNLYWILRRITKIHNVSSEARCANCHGNHDYVNNIFQRSMDKLYTSLQHHKIQTSLQMGLKKLIILLFLSSNKMNEYKIK